MKPFKIQIDILFYCENQEAADSIANELKQFIEEDYIYSPDKETVVIREVKALET